ncbi:uncharacterized protein STEHIDRAFT_157659 [Stereum hirsutum FP-91666 SS1]|uniref:uncharacterized protein n=1 Tax=Stereum hirsutum (strain FP-91666) TaxID=721885 RepID=UPI0004449ACD|nr:uncharacterized protein STEHIDRAFT_157659 [Stereum hirsutum FP-91666 SS1]EIM86152.1 hypothetical protein STEHIDRAFT_157659 [Stereum hirsutum FP-91666 SS1]
MEFRSSKSGKVNRGGRKRKERPAWQSATQIEWRERGDERAGDWGGTGDWDEGKFPQGEDRREPERRVAVFTDKKDAVSGTRHRSFLFERELAYIILPPPPPWPSPLSPHLPLSLWWRARTKAPALAVVPVVDHRLTFAHMEQPDAAVVAPIVLPLHSSSVATAPPESSERATLPPQEQPADGPRPSPFAAAVPPAQPQESNTNGTTDNANNDATGTQQPLPERPAEVSTLKPVGLSPANWAGGASPAAVPPNAANSATPTPLPRFLIVAPSVVVVDDDDNSSGAPVWKPTWNKMGYNPPQPNGSQPSKPESVPEGDATAVTGAPAAPVAPSTGSAQNMFQDYLGERLSPSEPKPSSLGSLSPPPTDIESTTNNRDVPKRKAASVAAALCKREATDSLPRNGKASLAAGRKTPAERKASSKTATSAKDKVTGKVKGTASGAASTKSKRTLKYLATEALETRVCKYCDHEPFSRAKDCFRHMNNSCPNNPSKHAEECPDCHKSLSRGDALKRHYKTCKEREERMAKENGTELPAPAAAGSVAAGKGKRSAEDDEQGSEGDKEKKKRKVATPRKKPATPRAGPKKKASGSASVAPGDPSAKDHASLFAQAEERLKGANGAPEGESEVGESELESEADEDAEGEPDGEIPAAGDVVMTDSAKPVPATSTETLQVQDIEMGDASRPKTTRRQSTRPPKPRAKRAGKNADGQVKGKELESEEGVSPPPGLNLLKGDGTLANIAADGSSSTLPGGAFTSAIFPSTTPGTTLPSSSLVAAADGSMSAPPSVLALDPNSKEGLAQRKCKFCDHPPFTRAQDCLRHMEHSCQANPNRKVTEVCDECHMQLSRSDALKRHYKTCGKSKRKGGKGASSINVPGKSGSSSAIVTGSGGEGSPSVGPSAAPNGKGKEKEKSKSQSPDKGVEGEGANVGEAGPESDQGKTDDASKNDGATAATGANDALPVRNAMVEDLLRAVEAARAAEMASSNPSAPSTAANGATSTANSANAALPPSVALTQADAFSQAIAFAQQAAAPLGQQQQGVPTTSSSLAGALGPAPAFVLDPALANATANTPVSLSAPGAPGVPPTMSGEAKQAPEATKEGGTAPAPVPAPGYEKGPAEAVASTTGAVPNHSQTQAQAAAAAAMLSAMNPAEQAKANEIANAIAAHLAIVHSQQQQQQQQQTAAQVQQQQGTNGQGAGASGQ